MDHLQTEGRNPASHDLDERTALEIVRLMNAEDAKVAPAVGTQAEVIARAVDVITERLRAGGRLVYVGAGTSGRLGVLDATECPPTFNAPPGQVVGLIAGGPTALTRAVEGAEDHPEFAERDLREINFSSRDVLVGIATSGRTPYVLGALEYARGLGAFTIGLSCNPDSELIPCADLAITPVVGPEVLSGSTRLKAGTATKLVLNMLTTGAMVRLGKCYGNLMVDLRATNEKLRIRTNRIVRQLTGLSAEEAGLLLERSGGELKTALVAQLAGVTPEEARGRLAAVGGRVRAALPAVRADTAAEPAGDLLLGIDGGGTHTDALLARVMTEGRWQVLGRGIGGPSNLHAAGTERGLRGLDEAVSAAFAAAGMPRVTVGAACLGLAGAGRAEDQVVVAEWAERVRLAEKVDVGGDTPLLLAAGTPKGWGVAVVAGTGSMAFARAPDGRTARSGGWGYILGDEGSGYALAVAGLRAAAQAADGRGTATSLLPRFLTELDLAQPPELIPAVYRGNLDRPALAALAPVVLGAAHEGDGVAADLVSEAAHELAVTVAAAARALELDHRPLPLALAGGLLLASENYRTLLREGLVTLGIEANPITLVSEPAEGALRMARALAQGRPSLGLEG